MSGSLYKFCDGCEHRKDTKTDIFCPSDFNPYDKEKCPRNARFEALEERKRLDKKKTGGRDFRW